jgi:DNA-binding winged helix-turn-helix (wHTH) protein
MSDISSVNAMPEFELGPLIVRPRERLLQSSTASVSVEPLVMQLLLALTRRAGKLVTRGELFEVCWGSSAVGDDSLNRIVAVLRKALQEVGANAVAIQTIPSAGYVLRIPGKQAIDGDAADKESDAHRAIASAYDSWRLGLPEPDHVRLEQLRGARASEPDNARLLGMLALLCRHAAEYGGPGTASSYVAECESAARRAIAIDSGQPEALTALASIVPLYGGWSEARRRLVAVLSAHPDHLIATQDLATLEMATGRVRVSKMLRDGLIAREPLSATLCYKSVYQHWSIGDLAGMDHVADRAIQLWPTHPAVWMVRLWTLAFTERVPAAVAMLEDRIARPSIPGPALTFFRYVLHGAAHRNSDELVKVGEACLSHAQTGPANAMAAMFALGLLNRHEELLELAESYYLRDGAGPVPVRHTDAELSLNEQHRRLTQVLFTPVFVNVRGESRFMSICDRVDLTRYWEENALTPDFLA